MKMEWSEAQRRIRIKGYFFLQNTYDKFTYEVKKKTSFLICQPSLWNKGNKYLIISQDCIYYIEVSMQLFSFFPSKESVKITGHSDQRHFSAIQCNSSTHATIINIQLNKILPVLCRTALTTCLQASFKINHILSILLPAKTSSSNIHVFAVPEIDANPNAQLKKGLLKTSDCRAQVFHDRSSLSMLGFSL